MRIGLLKNQYIVEWCMIGLITIFVMLSFTYVDNVSLTIWSTNMLDCLWEGNVSNYYQYNSLNLHNLAHQSLSGGFLILVPLAIWNIPIWIAQYFFGVEITTSNVCMFWPKLFYVVIFIIMLCFTKKICEKLWNDSQKTIYVILLCASSIYMHIGITYSGQNDILWITLGVVAFYYYLDDRWKEFLLFINLSLLMKPYFLLPCIAIVLIKEKSVIEVVKKLLLSVSGYVLMQIFLHFVPGYAESTIIAGNLEEIMFRKYLENTITTPFGEASVVIVVLLVIYLFCFIYQGKDEDITNRFAIYMMCVVMISWLVFGRENFYRVLMILPWLYILLIDNEQYFEVNMCLNVTLSFVWTIVYVDSTKVIFDSFRGMKPSILNVTEVKSIDELEVGTLYLLGQDIFAYTGGYDTLMKMVYAIWVVLLLAVLVINIPQYGRKQQKSIEDGSHKWFIRILLWLHILMVVPFVTLSCLRATGII